jgi:uncharacterized SAM-binding protein YcdF (DUF218 family)
MTAKPKQDDAAHRDHGPFVGADGFAMLALSVLVIACSVGLTLLAALVHVLRIGWMTPAAGPLASRILVMGYRLPPDGRPERRYQQRLDRGQGRLLSCPGSVMFLLGGRGRPGLASEAEAGALYLSARGVPPERIRLEDRSRHTLENLRHYRDAWLAEPDAPAVLVSSRFHLARACLMAAGLGIPCVGCAAEANAAEILHRPARLLVEAFLLHWYVVGCRFSYWTGNRHMLARIS